jgi:hypothetical protein
MVYGSPHDVCCDYCELTLQNKVWEHCISSPWHFKLIFLESFLLNYVLVVSRIEERWKWLLMRQAQSLGSSRGLGWLSLSLMHKAKPQMTKDEGTGCLGFVVANSISPCQIIWFCEKSNRKKNAAASTIL